MTEPRLKFTSTTPTKEARTQLMRARVESHNAPVAYAFVKSRQSFMEFN